MATKRVIAYYMHETERDAARQRLTAPETTDSYVLGDIDEAAIPQLEAQGLIVQEVAEPAEPETPGRAFSPLPGVTRRATRGAAAAPPPRRIRRAAVGPDYYLIQLRGPLLEGWRSQLNALGATLLEHVPRNAYTARLQPAQVQQIAQLGFVSGVRIYDSEDTGPVTAAPEAAPPPAEAVGRQMITYDIRLHQESERASILQWLGQQNVAVAGASGRKIRVYLLEGSSVPEEIAALPQVAAVEQYIAPKLHNDVARGLLGVDPAGNPGAPLGLTGQGQTVGVADTGLDDAHPDFAGRIAGIVALGRPGDHTDTHGHGTHVAGSILGDGSASGGALRGVAPGARLFFQSLLDARGGLGGLPLDLGDLFEEAYQNGARIHNNSWGSATSSMYTISSTEVDEFVAKRRDMLIIISAGNDGTASRPANAARGFVDWLSICSPASAKNALVVGASRSSRSAGGYSTMPYGLVWPSDYPDPPIASENVSGNAECLAAFSSRGPCDDRRVKPDVVAPGTDVASAKSRLAPLRHFWGPYPNNASYAFMGGTSMAAPLVAGCAALLREYFAANGRPNPSAALMRATLINGTRWLGGADAIADHADCPNYHQGFGSVSMRTTIPNPDTPALRLEVIDTWQTPGDQFGVTGQRFRYQFRTGGTVPLRLCLAWTDLPARGTQNSLALMLQEVATGRKWVANENLHGAITRPDPDNNTQIIRLDQPAAGDYLIQVFARNILRPPQDWALAVSGDLAAGLTRV